MNRFTSKRMGNLMMITGFVGVLAFVTLLLFFLGLFQEMYIFGSMGTLNDGINALLGILSAILAATFYQAMRGFEERLVLAVTIVAWIGAAAVLYGSWLIMTGRSDVERSSYFYFFGFGSIGVWVWVLNSLARKENLWPRHLTRWGLAASVFMMVGLVGLAGILMGWDGDDFSPLVQTAGISFLGTGILYPIWCLRTGGWILSRQGQPSAISEGDKHE